MSEGIASPLAGRLARLGLVYIAARVVQVAALFMVLPVVTRLLDKDQFGVVVIAQVAHQAVVATVSLGLTSVVAWSIYERGGAGLDDARAMVTATTAISVLLTALVAASAPLWTRVFADVGNPPALQIAVWMAIPATVQSACLSVLQAQGRARAFAVSTMVCSAGGQLLGLGMLWWFRSPASYVAGLMVGFVLGAGIAAVCIPLRIARFPPPRHVAAALRHGGPTVVHLLGFWLLAVGDRVVIERVMGIDAAARYQAAYSIGALGLAVLFALNNAWAPTVYDSPSSGDWSVLLSSTKWVYWFATVLMSALALGAPLLLSIAVPASYSPNDLVPVAVIVLASLVPNVTYLAAVHVVFRRRRTALLFVIVPLAGVVNLGLCLVLIPRWGLVGAATATLVGYAVGGFAAMAAAHAVEPLAWDRKTEGLCYLLAAIVTLVAATLVGGPLVVAVRCAGAAIVILLGLTAAHRVFRQASLPAA
jgi:O-antigen/teichoic acid export membrane protein